MTQTGNTPGFFIERMDPRSLLVVWASHSLVLATIPRQNLSKTILLGVFPAFLFMRLGLRLMPFLRRLRIALPFVAMMVLSNSWADRQPIDLTEHLRIPAGLLTGLVLACKASISILALHVLEQIVSLDRICAGLRSMRVPEPLTNQLLFLQRYARVVSAEAESMIRARDMRAVGHRGRGILASARLTGTLFLRSHDRSRRIHRSLLSRGFTGSMPLPESDRLKPFDLAWGAVLISLLLGVRICL